MPQVYEQDLLPPDPINISLAFAPPDQRREDPTFIDSLSAAFQRHNVFWALSELMTKPSFPEQDYERFYDAIEPVDPSKPYHPSSNPYKNIAGYDSFASRFSFSRSIEETDYIKNQIGRELKSADTLERSGAMGIFTSIAAGMIDPFVFVPPIKALRGARLGLSLFKQIGPATLQNAAIIAGQEAILHTSQYTRTKQESLVAVTFGAVLTGSLTGMFSGMSRARQGRIARIKNDVEVEFGKDLERHLAKGTDEGAAEVTLSRPGQSEESVLEDVADAMHEGGTPDAVKNTLLPKWFDRWIPRVALARHWSSAVRDFYHKSMLSAFRVVGVKPNRSTIEGLYYAQHGKTSGALNRIVGLYKDMANKTQDSTVGAIDVLYKVRAPKEEPRITQF